MRIKKFDLVLAMAMLIALLNLLWTWRQGHSQVIGTIIALPMAYLLPGYTLLKTLFYGIRLTGTRLLILSIATSLALDVVSGLALNMTPLGLSRLSWTIYLSSLTLLFSLIAMLLQMRQRETIISRVALLLTGIELRKHKKQHILAGIVFLVAVSIAAFSLQYSINSATHQKRSGFTQLWVVQTNQAHYDCAVSIGVSSFEFKPITYRIVMSVNGSQTEVWSSITLSPQKVWRASVPIMPVVLQGATVNVQLYRTDKPTIVYRNVHLKLLSLPSNKNTQGHQCTT